MTELLNTDVLVLGSGLAGMRAAIAALEHDPGLNVLIATVASGPTGSSFANANKMLGVQTLETDDDKTAFQREALALAHPGFVDERLVEILAEESQARVRDLELLGLQFKPGDDGQPLRMPGCFSPLRPTGRVFTNLSGAHGLFQAKARALGAGLLAGHLVRALISDEEDGVFGAVLEDRKTRGEVLVRAKTVVAALGGPAALYSRNMAGRGASGDSYGILARAGVRLENTGFLQFMWTDISRKEFWPIASLAKPGVRITAPDGRVLSIRQDLDPRLTAALVGKAMERNTHCPVGYGLDDAVLDNFLAANLGPQGHVRVHDPDHGWIMVAPQAHAGNGGAVIDIHGQTTVPGLFACGECATGMHGANRIGGAMVLATQVFGARAGAAAAKQALETPHAAEKRLRSMRAALPNFQILGDQEEPEADTGKISWLKQNMQRYAVLGGRDGLASFHARLQRKALNVGGPLFKLRADAALTVTAHLAKMGRNAQPRDSSITLAA